MALNWIFLDETDVSFSPMSNYFLEITFTTCKLLIDEKVIFTADGIFKILINKEGKSTSSTYPFYAD